jgi:hypothetical protein
VSWVLLRRARACNMCGQAIDAGEVARLGRNVRGYVWCIRCAERGLLETPPADTPPFEDLAPLAGSQRELPLDDSLSAAIGRTGPGEDRR